MILWFFTHILSLRSSSQFDEDCPKCQAYLKKHGTKSPVSNKIHPITHQTMYQVHHPQAQKNLIKKYQMTKQNKS